jgi:pimeloyl-ACP methyl ester carboxylesterase
MRLRSHDPAGGDMTYDEFALFRENVDEYGLPWNGAPSVRRAFVDVDDGRRVSALVWGEGPPEVVLVHGGAQNAHTWDTVALALRRPLVCIDLPGHGHSDWRDDHDYWPWTLAPDVATAMRTLAPEARLLCGMSLGGLTSIIVAADNRALVARLVVVDVTPWSTDQKGAAIGAFVGGPEVFEDFDALLARTIEHNPTRSASSLRRGVLHNAQERSDGTWSWRYDRPTGERGAPDTLHYAPLWDALASFAGPALLVRGSASPVVEDADAAEFQRRCADGRVIMVEGAGHSVQGDKPLELAAILEAELSA